jgi:hypothetical protein
LINQPASLFAAIGCCLFTLYFSALRIYELSNIPQNIEIPPEYPIWIFMYLRGISFGLAMISLIGLYYSLLALCGVLKRRWLVVPALLYGLWILARGFYLLQDPDVGAGGVIWGVYDVITLTRNMATATQAGAAGYRVGQVLGLIVFATFPMVLLYAAFSVPYRRTESADEQNHAPKPDLHGFPDG